MFCHQSKSLSQSLDMMRRSLNSCVIAATPLNLSSKQQQSWRTRHLWSVSHVRLMRYNLGSGSDARGITYSRWGPPVWVNIRLCVDFSIRAPQLRRSLRTGATFITSSRRTNHMQAVSSLDHFIHELVRMGMLEIAQGRRRTTKAYECFQVPTSAIQSAIQGIPHEHPAAGQNRGSNKTRIAN